jgi:hypothetical protein
VAVPTAKAADLGGDCCADLEERVAELEATTARKGNRKVSLTISGQVNRSMMYWNDGFQKDIYSVDNAVGNSRFRLLGNAKINPALTAGFLMEFDLTIGARSHQVNQIDDDGQTGAPIGGAANGDGVGGAGDSALGLIHANWYLDHKDLGRLTVGRMSTTTAGISIIDLSNQVVAANSQTFLWGGSMIMRNGAGVLSNVAGAPASTWGQMTCGSGAGAGAFSVDCGISALSRRDAIMYNTPTWGGFIAGVSFGENNFWDASLRYGGEFAGFRVAAGVGYRSYKDQEADALVVGPPSSDLSNTDRRQTLASGSVMHVASGLYVTGSWYKYEYHGTNLQEIVAGTAGTRRPDTTNWYLSGGIQQNWTGLGATTLYGEYSKTNDGITGLCTGVSAVCAAASVTILQGLGSSGFVTDSEMRMWGFGVVQNVSAAAMDLYLGYRRYSQDVTTSTGIGPTGGLEDIWYVQGGARIQF